MLPAGVSDAVGITHFLEVAYVLSNIGAAATQEHTEVAHLMSRYWASFIADLDPNGGDDMFVITSCCSYPPCSTNYWPCYSLLIVGPSWPAYSLAEPQIMAFDVNMTDLATPIADTYRAEHIQYINDNLGPLGRK